MSGNVTNSNDSYNSYNSYIIIIIIVVVIIFVICSFTVSLTTTKTTNVTTPTTTSVTTTKTTSLTTPTSTNLTTPTSVTTPTSLTTPTTTIVTTPISLTTPTGKPTLSIRKPALSTSVMVKFPNCSVLKKSDNQDPVVATILDRLSQKDMSNVDLSTFKIRTITNTDLFCGASFSINGLTENEKKILRNDGWEVTNVQSVRRPEPVKK